MDLTAELHKAVDPDRPSCPFWQADIPHFSFSLRFLRVLHLCGYVTL